MYWKDWFEEGYRIIIIHIRAWQKSGFNCTEFYQRCRFTWFQSSNRFFRVATSKKKYSFLHGETDVGRPSTKENIMSKIESESKCKKKKRKLNMSRLCKTDSINNTSDLEKPNTMMNKRIMIPIKKINQKRSFRMMERKRTIQSMEMRWNCKRKKRSMRRKKWSSPNSGLTPHYYQMLNDNTTDQIFS